MRAEKYPAQGGLWIGGRIFDDSLFLSRFREFQVVIVSDMVMDSWRDRRLHLGPGIAP